MLKIGILDSGLGGYNALLDIKSHYPEYEYAVYLDRENAPYGNRSGEEIFNLTEIGCKELWSEGCELILIACNTICAETLKHLQNKYSPPLNPLPLREGKESKTLRGGKILGCIIPSVEVAIQISDKNIGLLATQFTIDSQKYNQEIAKLSQYDQLFSVATPELAGFIESGMALHRYTLEYLERRIEKLLTHNIDTIILGCTHYTVYYEHISLKYPHLKIVDSAKTQTIKLGEYLRKHSELFEK